MAQQAKCFPQNLNSLTLTPPSLAGQPTPQRRPPPLVSTAAMAAHLFS